MKHPLSFPSLRFADAQIESDYQDDYFANSLRVLRSAGGLFVLVCLIQIYRWIVMEQGGAFVFRIIMIGVGVLLIGLTYWPNFRRVWQPLIVTIFLLATIVVFNGIAGIVESDSLFTNKDTQVGWFSTAVMAFMIGCATLRLGFTWATVLLLGLVLEGSLTSMRVFGASAQTIADRFSLGVLSALLACAFLAYAHETLQRRAFLAKRKLAQSEAAERARRQHTESMLKVLSQAIGGIVHDLGNPLTSVQTGAETMEIFIADGATDQETLQEFLDIINDGARMLNYLRLSLMEQIRVLEGEPIPLNLTPASIHQIVEAGARYQKPKFTSGRKIEIDGETVQILADEMKLVAVFMNLIGNALKYSDHEVHVSWQQHSNQLLIAVADKGIKDHGLSKDQAEKLFVPFGRLETHESIEGTGLGLLSVRKIIEAHGGEAFIEGYEDGTFASPFFSTGKQVYPSLLSDQYLTAFVVTCPFGKLPANTS